MPLKNRAHACVCVRVRACMRVCACACLRACVRASLQLTAVDDIATVCLSVCLSKQKITRR